jgi:hypothetical protein
MAFPFEDKFAPITSSIKLKDLQTVKYGYLYDKDTI